MSSDIISVDTKDLEKYIERIKNKGDLTAKKVMNAYVNNMAFAVKKNTNDTMKFNWKNSSTERFTKRNVYIKKAPKQASMDNQISEIGALGNMDGDSRSTIKGGYLARQEFGGKVKQVKSGGSGIRTSLMARNTKEMKPKEIRRINSFVEVGTAKTKSRAFANAIRQAYKEKKKYISNSKGIFILDKFKTVSYNQRTMKARIVKRKSARLLYGIKNQGSISVPKRSWLKPATDKALQNQNTIILETMQFIDKMLKK